MPDQQTPETGPAAAPVIAPQRQGNRKVATACMIMATLMFALDSTIANVALPYMRGTMSATQDQINWVLTSYLVATAIMTAPVGFFAARFGRTRLFVLSVVGFTLTSILCGAAQSLDQMVFFRILQGMCGAPLIPLSQAVIFDLYLPEERGRVMSLWVIGVNLGPILGPTVGGWLTQDYSWRWVFYINVPLGIATALGLWLNLKETSTNRSSKLDWLGFGALSLAVGALQTVLDRGETLDWFSSPEIIVETVLAGLGFYFFLVQSALAPKPFLSPRLLTDINFVIGTTIYFVLGLILYASLALLAPYLQEMMNYPVITSGVAMAPRGAGTMIAGFIAGRAVGRVGARPLIFLGLLLTAYGLRRAMAWTPDVSEWDIALTSFIQGAGISCITLPLAILTFSTLAPEMRTEAAGVYNLLRNMGSSIGISVTGALLVSNSQINQALISEVITPFNRALQSPLIERFWNPGTPIGAAALDSEITRQATIIAYNDDYKLMLLLTLAITPLLLLIRPAPKPVPSGER
jgi:DHA2 family multidrug resistance protein